MSEPGQPPSASGSTPAPADDTDDASVRLDEAPDQLDVQLSCALSGCRLHPGVRRGGLGGLYGDHQLSLGSLVAVKVIAADQSAQPHFVARERVDARVVASLDH